MDNIQITKIQNGFLMIIQEKSSVMVHSNQPLSQPKAIVHFCKDVDEVCDYLKELSTN